MHFTSDSPNKVYPKADGLLILDSVEFKEGTPGSVTIVSTYQQEGRLMSRKFKISEFMHPEARSTKLINFSDRANRRPALNLVGANDIEFTAEGEGVFDFVLYFEFRNKSA